MADIIYALFWISTVITPMGAFLVLWGIVGMFLNRKNTKHKDFKEMQKLTIIGLTMVCIGFGICGAFFFG
ncbi:MAG: hypothetical protein KGV56_01645 [Gammaproteobacteria bacterium]|nr:hypothetical protein [Gammaproteobacteria bacterium]